MKRVSTFCPAGISSFFQAVISDTRVTTTDEACRIGARGGGFILEEGVDTEIKLHSAEQTTIQVSINGKLAPEAKVTREVCSLVLAYLDDSYELSIDHQIAVPIGAGYSTSAAGAVSTGLALSKAIGLNLTLNQVAQLAHTAEIRCATGLGSVSGVIRGGAILILEPGAPGFDRVDWLLHDPSLRIVTGSFAPIPKDDIIFSKERLVVVNREAEKILKRVLVEPDLELFLELCYKFAKKAGFLSSHVKKMVETATSSGALGATQNMIGDAFHALVDVHDVEKVKVAIKEKAPHLDLLVTGISLGGPRFT